MTLTKTFDQLSERAKQKARDWWRECEAQEFGAFGELFEPAETAAKLLGIEFNSHDVPLHGGKTRQDPKIWWSGFSSQGDGLSFEGRYEYAKESSKKIRAEFPTDNTLQDIADELTALQVACRLRTSCMLTAKITQDGRGVHEYTMSADVYQGDSEAEEETAKAMLELVRRFARWIYKGLEAEYDYRMSDECVDESILANGYTFMVDGNVVLIGGGRG